jgi:uncharacterized protein with beta-barrel porin domain
LAYGWQDITTDRSVTVASVDQLGARFNANALSGLVEGGYRFATPAIAVKPHAAGQFAAFNLPAYAVRCQYARSGLWREGRHRYAISARRSHRQIICGAGRMTLRGRFAWAHDFNTDRNIAVTLSDAARRILSRQRRRAKL